MYLHLHLHITLMLPIKTLPYVETLRNVFSTRAALLNIELGLDVLFFKPQFFASSAISCLATMTYTRSEASNSYLSGLKQMNISDALLVQLHRYSGKCFLLRQGQALTSSSMIALITDAVAASLDSQAKIRTL
ncbi:hypothetical protein DICVIV_12616 [Dictyocaulus viviparus]|uniref:Uncharacterized protein n=1 Tax=Dictyocaulus viviparus TaxID=29172 RepID=A0A0D8X9Z4_DICVI|nr:hypothetical protein DICVIV_12616 [Dictyocaulus viviparus]